MVGASVRDDRVVTGYALDPFRASALRLRNAVGAEPVNAAGTSGLIAGSRVAGDPFVPRFLLPSTVVEKDIIITETGCTVTARAGEKVAVSGPINHLSHILVGTR